MTFLAWCYRFTATANQEKRGGGLKEGASVGLVVRSLTENPFIVNVNNPKDPRWAVLWTNPLYTMDDGTSVQYESELEVIGEAG